jgi:hypothetical protein
MAYAQWVSIAIKSDNCDITIKNAHLAWGKFYQCGDKDREISAESINGKVVSSGSTFTICACGRENSASGTEGSFDLYVGDLHVGSYYWNCPWGSATNTSTWTKDNGNFLVELDPAGNLNSGALGNVGIEVYQKK